MHKIANDCHEKPLILALDDEPDLLELYEMTLSDHCDVISYTTPLTAMARVMDVNERPVDLLITDLSMPLINGNHVVKELRRMGFSGPVVMVSGHLEREALLEGFDAGISYCIEKPLDLDRLTTEVQRLLKGVETLKIQSKIRRLLGDLREIYIGFRLVCEPYVPQDVLDGLMVERKLFKSESGAHQSENNALDFDLVLDQLEEELEEMMSLERNQSAMTGKKRAA